MLGVFDSVDPVTAYDQPMTNFCRYCYGRNNPYKFTDPDGRDGANFYTDPNLRMAAPSSWEGVGVIADFLPVIGDIKGVVGAIREPTFTNIAAAGVGLVPVVGDAAGAMARGVASEARVLKAMGEVKNTEKVVTSQGRSIPDFQNARQVGEIKDTQRVSNTAQVRAQREHAQATGREHTVVTGTNTKVSSTVEQQSKVIRRDDLGPQR